MQKTKSWLKGGVGTTLLGFALTVVWDLIKDKPLLSTLSKAYNWFFEKVLYLLNIELKVWWLILFFLVCFIILFIADFFYSKLEAEPDFCSYKEEVFIRWTWRWEWKKSTMKQGWVISNLKPFCPACDSPIIPKPIWLKGTFAECSRCQAFFGEGKIEDRPQIEPLILDNIRKGIYKRESSIV